MKRPKKKQESQEMNYAPQNCLLIHDIHVKWVKKITEKSVIFPFLSFIR